jgi:hypothetical protein
MIFDDERCAEMMEGNLINKHIRSMGDLNI